MTTTVHPLLANFRERRARGSRALVIGLYVNWPEPVVAMMNRRPHKPQMVALPPDPHSYSPRP